MDEKNKLDNDSLVDILRVDGVNAKGFGSIPKIVMKDQRLTIQAKAIYAYFCSYAGMGNQAFPGIVIILRDLGISENTYYKHIKLLKLYDYIRVEQKKIKGGKWSRNIYTLISKPNSPYLNICGTAHLSLKKCGTVPSLKNACTVNCGTKINSNRINIDLSINHKYIDKMDMMDDYMRIVKQNIDYSSLFDQETDKGLVKNIFMLIIDVLCSESENYKIGGVNISADQVKRRFLELDQNDVSSVILGITKLDRPIRSARNYLITALYNAPTTSQAKWKSEINSIIRQHNEKKENF